MRGWVKASECRVLICDNSDTACSAFKLRLSSLGFRKFSTLSVVPMLREAIEHDLVVLDWNFDQPPFFPDDFLDLLSTLKRGPRVLIISADFKIDRHLKEKWFEYGHIIWCTKGCSNKDLIKKLEFLEIDLGGDDVDPFGKGQGKKVSSGR